jgi:sugar phosphate isomerase/epimerase
MFPLSRRAFSHTLLAGAALCALRSTVAAPHAAKKMTIALTPGSIGVSVRNQREIIDLAVKYGFESIEPIAGELGQLDENGFAKLKEEMAAKGLVWVAAGLPVDFRGDESAFDAGMKTLPTLAAGLQRAGVTRMGTWLSPSHPTLTYRKNFAQHVERLRAIAKVLNDHGLRFGLEYVGTQSLLTRPKYPFVHTMAETRELIAEISQPNVGLVLDSWHWWTAGDSVEEVLSLKNEDVVSVDLNDAPRGVPKEAVQDNARELPAATGVIDVKTFLDALRKIEYDGPVRAEPFNNALNALDNDAACAATIAAMKKAFAL